MAMMNEMEYRTIGKALAGGYRAAVYCRLSKDDDLQGESASIANQRDFMPEDTKAGMIQAYLDKYTGSMVCSKQLYKEALNHAFDEPQQWEIREINEIMNQCISGWRYFPNPRMFSEYGRQKGWERENPATDSGNPSEKTMDGFVEVTEQMELPF